MSLPKVNSFKVFAPSASFQRKAGQGVKRVIPHSSTLIDMVATPTASFKALEKIGLLHDTKELLFVDFTVTVPVCFVDHLLKLFIGHPLSQFFCDALQILERDLAGFIIIEK